MLAPTTVTCWLSFLPFPFPWMMVLQCWTWSISGPLSPRRIVVCFGFCYCKPTHEWRGARWILSSGLWHLRSHQEPPTHLRDHHLKTYHWYSNLSKTANIDPAPSLPKRTNKHFLHLCKHLHICFVVLAFWRYCIFINYALWATPPNLVKGPDFFRNCDFWT